MPQLDAVKSAVHVCRRPCAALHRSLRCAVLNCVSSETGVMLNMSPARPSKLTPGVEYPLKQNIFDQVFM